MSAGLSPTALLLVGLGGALGSMARHAVSVATLSLLGAGFPWGTLAVNILGSAAIGVAAGAGLQGDARLLLVTGFLGGFTTFSAFSLEAGALAARAPALAMLYVAASVGFGLAAFALAWWLAQR
ncbi:fluoride efflux transporter FluC [Falsiroseomonas sp.]|uniref:fluoride efflux transporter FluC n=1 Tax=Falsiroseomonas sp. TaxID=2870721 RepID=UPI00356A658D